jgi:hypothetical protein
MKPKLQSLCVTTFVARWQNRMFKSCVENFSDDVVVFVFDFAENYNFEI